MGDLIEILRQKAVGQRNKAGDLWGDWVCEKAADELARKDAEIASLGKRYADSESKLAFCDAALQDMQARAERAEARVREAVVVEAEPFRETGSAGSYPYAAIALIGEVAKRIGGKRVALVRLDTEEAK